VHKREGGQHGWSGGLFLKTHGILMAQKAVVVYIED